MTDRNFEIVRRLSEIAAADGHSINELALAWLLAQPQVPAVIAGASTPAQVEQNVRAVEWRLSPERVADVKAIAAEVDRKTGSAAER